MTLKKRGNKIDRWDNLNRRGIRKMNGRDSATQKENIEWTTTMDRGKEIKDYDFTTKEKLEGNR